MRASTAAVGARLLGARARHAGENVAEVKFEKAWGLGLGHTP